MQQIQNSGQNKKTSKCEGLLICNNDMVLQLDSRWNQVYASLYLPHSKLEKFGVTHINDEVAYLGEGSL